MKKFAYAAALALVAMAANVSIAQRIDLKSGNVGVLSGQKTVNVEYDYSEFAGIRIAESYAKAGKSLAAFLDKKL